MLLPSLCPSFRALTVWALGASLGFAAEASSVRFDRDIRPLLSDKCFHCHGPDAENRAADLRLDLKATAVGDEEGAPFKPHDLDASLAWQRITSDDPYERMPPPDSHKSLSPAEIQLIREWLEAGAPWTEHWAFVAPQPAAIPTVEGSQWVRNPIDALVLARLQENGLLPSPEATRETLIRRLSFDLTGLPPSVEEVRAFVADDSPDAYEALVDRLLASNAYGERMAVMWLDAARYGDTSVYHADGPRDMWAWRDAIVAAYNDNRPFDDFSIAQIAGDLLESPTLEQRVLSGFNRNNGTTDEGGAIAEEYRVEYAIDRVKTTSMVWLGLTMECAQCHDHKYDAISQVDYYRFFAFFNASEDAGMQTRSGNAQPTVDVPDPQREAELPRVVEQIGAVDQAVLERRSSAASELAAWVAKLDAEPQPQIASPIDAIAHLPLDEGSGQQTANAATGQAAGQIKGTAQWLTERGGALRLDGSTHVDLGDIGNFAHTDAFSFGGWLRIKAGASGALLARMDSSNAYRGYDILLQGGKITTHFINTWPTNAIKVHSKETLTPDVWHHVFVTYDGSLKAAGVKIYVDGQPWEWEIEQDRLQDTIQTDKTLLIGTRHGGGALTGDVDDLRMYPRSLSATEIQTLAEANPLDAILAVAPEKRSEEQQAALAEYFFGSVDKPTIELRAERQRLQTQAQELRKPLTSVMVMGDMAQPRETFVLLRGSYDSPSDVKVQPGTPAILPPMLADAPPNRLGLARWLFRDDHPLTARVAVNRYWNMLFGHGLVSTLEDFGSQGAFPDQPELLDWLANDFRENGWDVKRSLKQIVMSSTYRQSAAAPVQAYQDDPENRLLARGPRFRLPGEFIRDNALVLSGLLVDDIGGPGVKPYQPPGLWAQVGLSGVPVFTQDHGESLYRRSLYTYWKRSAPPPSMQIFDAPTREKCTLRRPRTNTPLQALVTLNDVQFVEAARGFAQRAMLHSDDPAERMAFLFQSATARLPNDDEQKTLLSVLAESELRYAANPAAAEELLKFGESPRDTALDATQHAAWTIVASLILNLDEVLTRP